jgi:hypothetical protein
MHLAPSYPSKLAGCLGWGSFIASVREGRIGYPVAQWFVECARQHGRFNIEVIDLEEVDLPVFAERNHPRLQKYENENEKQKAWSARVASLDAFVFVTPEYSYGPRRRSSTRSITCSWSGTTRQRPSSATAGYPAASARCRSRNRH